MLLKFKLILLRPIYSIRKIFLNWFFKITLKKSPQLHKYDQILIELQKTNNHTLNSLFNKLSGGVIRRDCKEVPKAGKYSVFKQHPIYDSFSYLEDSCKSLIDKNFIILDNSVLKLKPLANEFLEEKEGFVKELSREKLSNKLDISFKVVKIIGIVGPSIIALINIESIFEFFNSILHSTFCK